MAPVASAAVERNRGDQQQEAERQRDEVAEPGEQASGRAGWGRVASIMPAVRHGSDWTIAPCGVDQRR